MKSILVPTDFSKTATNAAHFAAILCKDYGLDMHLLHAMHIPQVTEPSAAVPISQILMDNERKQTTERLEDLSNELLDRYGVDSVLHSEFGLGSDVILGLADKLESDMIIMGTNGESGFFNSLFGSVTSAVAEKTEVPLLAVPNKANYRGFKVAVFGNDHKEDVSDQIASTLRFIAPFKARLDMVSVDPSREDFSQEIIYEEGDMRHVSVWDSSISKGLQQYMKNESADLLVVKHHNRNFIQDIFQRSTTKDLLKESTIPILIFNK